MKVENKVDFQDIKKSLKATTLFGGVQIFSIIVSIIRNKIIAVLIGPLGVGVVELYHSTINLIKSFTDFSLHVSAVRDISVSYKTGNAEKFSHTVTVFSRIVWFTGILGTLVCLLGSPFWSKLTFGDYSYTIGFALVSCVLLFNQLQRGKAVLLQGTEHYRYLAYSGILGNVLGLVTTLPIYYFLGLDGIVPVLIITAATAYILTYYYADKIKVENAPLTNKTALVEGRTMLKQGFLISVNYLLSALVFYILRIFITDKGGVTELGLYTASFAIVNSYVGLVFQSMGQEYYPRLSTLSSDKTQFRQAVNDQIYLTLLVLGPLVAVFLTFSDYLLSILYSEKFIAASTLMAISMIGVLFQAPSWCMSYTLLAKGDNKAFLVFETVAKILRILLDISFYYLWGLTGLGVSFFLSYVYYTIQCAFVCKKKYGLLLNRTNMAMLIIYMLVGICTLYLFTFINLPLRLVIGSFILILVSLYSYKQLSKIVNIKDFLINKLLKRR